VTFRIKTNVRNYFSKTKRKVFLFISVITSATFLIAMSFSKITLDSGVNNISARKSFGRTWK